MSKKVNTRSRNFLLMFYEEHANTVRRHLISYVEKGVIRSYYLIQHNPEEEGKSYHFHCVVEYWNAKTKTAVCKNLELDERFVEYCTSVRESINYLTHRYERGKLKYDVNEIDTNDKERLMFYYMQKNDMKCDLVNEFFYYSLDFIIKNYRLPWFMIFRKLSDDSRVDCKLLGRYASCLHTIYESVEFDKYKFKAMDDNSIREMLELTGNDYLKEKIVFVRR